MCIFFTTFARHFENKQHFFDNMKKLAMGMLAMLLVVVSLAGCKKKDSISKEQLVGKWLLTKYEIQYMYVGDEPAILYDDPQVTYEFLSDGTLIGKYAPEDYLIFEGQWTLNGKKLLMNELNHPERDLEWTITTFSSGKMEAETLYETVLEGGVNYSEKYFYYFEKQ